MSGGYWSEEATLARLRAAVCTINADGFDLEAHLRWAARKAVASRRRARREAISEDLRRRLKVGIS